MSNLRSLATMAAAATFFTSALGAFDPYSNSNMVVYWGRGPNQKPLSHFCADPNIDIINIGFLNQFPDQTKGYPGTNFGNQCGPETYTNPDGSSSPFLSHCPSIGPDIITCQKAGKKVFLSLGGAIPSNQTVMNEASAQSFAEILWTSFGPKTDTNAPRPFGDAVVDGFDFDIESVLKPGEDKEDLSRGYSSLINGLRAYYLSSNGSYYISGAPQCIVPDAHLADAIETAFFDFLFVQFYNTAECSARAYFDHSYGGKNTNISFSGWVDFVHTHGLNKETKVYLGLPASNDANDVVDPKMYLQPKEAKEMIQAFQCEYPEDFGGVMLYEATASETHPINGVPYADVLKKDLNQGCNPNPPVANSTSSASSTKASSSASSTKASSTAATFPTMVPSSLPFGLAPPSSSGAPYPISSGSAPSSGPTGSSGVVVPSGSVSSKSGTAPYSFKTGTAPYSTETGTTPYTMKSGTSASASATVVPSGASSGYLPSGSGSGSSSIPYPVSNSSSAISTGGYSSSTTTSGEEVVTLTDVVTLTSCGPEVTNCPARSHPVVSTETHISTIHSGSSASVSAGSSSYAASTPGNRPQSSEEVATSSSVPAGGASGPSSASSVPGNSPQTTQEVVTTDIVTSYVTTCPVTSTATSGGSQIIETGSTVSTVYSTIISTICTKCVAPPTSAPTQKASPSAPVSESQSPFTGTVTPSASIQEVVTTMIEYTTLTTCPVTNTVTSGTSEIVQVTQSVSTITSTYISTICTKCVAPPTGAPAPGSGAHGPSTTPVAVIPGSGHQGPPLPMPAGPSSAGSTPVASIPGSGHQGVPQPMPAGPSSAGSTPVASIPGSGHQGVPQPMPAGPSSVGSTPVASIPGSAHQGAPQRMPAGPSSVGPTPVASIPGSAHQGAPQPMPAGPSEGSSSPAGSSPAGSKSPSHEVESGAQGGNVPSSPASQGPESPAGSNSPSNAGSPIPAAQPAANKPASPESQSGAQGGSQPAAPAAQASAASPVGSAATGPHTLLSTMNVIPVQTLTIVPIPVSPSQTAKPKTPIESAEEKPEVPSQGTPSGSTPGNAAPGNAAPGSSAPGSTAAGRGAPGSAAPFPASNGTIPASPSGSASPSSGTGSSPQPSVEAFKGAASRTDAGVFGIVSFVVAAVLML